MWTRREGLRWLPLAFTGCKTASRPVIAVIPKAVGHLFFAAVHAGVKRAGSEANLEVVWNGPNEETDHGRQIQIVDSMIARRVSAIAISATDERALQAPIERAIRAGIPVAIFDSGVDVEGYVTFVATDNHGAGCDAARRLAELVGRSGQVAMVMQRPGGRSTELRERGFRETLAAECPGVRIAGAQYCNSDRAKARAVTENMLTANPKLAGIFASSEAASLGAIQALQGRGLGGKVKLITFDTSEAHVDALRNGTVSTMMVQDSARMGYEVVSALAQKLRGRTPGRRLDLPVRMIEAKDLKRPDVNELLAPTLD